QYGTCDVFQHMTPPGFPLWTDRLNAYLIPDLTTVHYPQHHVNDTKNVMNEYYHTVIKYADVVTTYSRHTREDVVRTLGISAEKVVSVPLGCDPEFRPVSPEEARGLLDKLGLRFGQYLLSVGTIEPRKNHITLFRAYAKLKARGRVPGLPL